MRDRADQELLDQAVDGTVQRRREQQSLTRPGGLCEQPLDRGQEAEVRHVVGLVEDRDLDVGQGARTLLDQVLEASGAGDDDVDALAEGLDLRVPGRHRRRRCGCSGRLAFANGIRACSI